MGLGRSRSLETSTASTSTTLDICFCLDATGSMGGRITQVKASMVQLAKDITSTNGLVARFALVVYRDYGDDDAQVQFWDFQSADEMESTLATVHSHGGGGDGAEDCFGGLWAATTRPPWEALVRVIVWMGDYPEHGTLYNDIPRDRYPRGDPKGLTAEAIFEEIKKRQLRLAFCRLTPYTDQMIEVLLKKAAVYGPELLLYFKVVGEMTLFLNSMLSKLISQTVIDQNVELGQTKEFQQVEADFEELNEKWKNTESVIVSSIKPFKANDNRSITQVLNKARPIIEEQPREMTLRMTVNPADSGEMRIVYYAMVTDEAGHPLSDSQKYVLKESKFEGGQNSKKALLEQASMQTTAASLAKEFTLRLEEVHVSTRLEYVPVELVRVPERPVGRDWLSMEPFIEGDFVKFHSNNGQIDKKLEAEHPAVGAFSHFTFCQSQGLLMVTDIQGVVGSFSYTLTDPAIHTTDQKKHFPDPTNLGKKGMDAFFKTHECKTICKKLKLWRGDESKKPKKVVKVPVEEETKSTCHCWPFRVY